jgi:hypothetical protein
VIHLLGRLRWIKLWFEADLGRDLVRSPFQPIAGCGGTKPVIPSYMRGL